MIKQTQQIFLRYPLAISIIVAFVIRTVAAFSNYGPYGHDDFINVIEPALRHLFLGVTPEVPNLRFEFLPYLFSYFMKPLYVLGVRRVDLLVSFAFFIIGIISLVQIVAMHRIGQLLFKEKTRNAMTFFCATWAIAPVFTNSADIAAPTYVLMSFALLHLILSFPEKFSVTVNSPAINQQRHIFLTGFFISAAILFRFSLAPVYFALFIWIAWAARPQNKIIPSLFFFSLGGLVTTLLMFGLEILSDRAPLSTAIEFIRYNFASHIATQSYGEMPWFTYIGLSLLYPIPGPSLFLWPFALKYSRKFSGFTVIYLAFLLSHSAIAFKLDRYLIPMLPILTIWIFAALEEYRHNKIFLRAYRSMLFMNATLVAPVALTMQQRAGVDGAIFAGKVAQPLFVSQISPWRESYYGFHNKPPIFADTPQEILRIAIEKKFSEFAIYRFRYYSRKELSLFQSEDFECSLEKVFRPDLLERIAIYLNPEMNGRRDDTTIYLCVSNREKSYSK